MSGEKKWEIELSDQVKGEIDKLLESGDKEKFMELTDAFKKIAEDPYAGVPVIFGYDDVSIGIVNSLRNKEIKNIGFEGGEDWKAIYIVVDGKDITLEFSQTEHSVVNDFLNENYKYCIDGIKYDEGYNITIKNIQTSETIDIKSRGICITDEGDLRE